MTRPFFTAGDAADETYVFTRDSEHWDYIRERIEQQWQRFRPLCGDDEDHFLADARANGQQRLWEIWTACMMLDHGHTLDRPPSDAPDIKWMRETGVVWIEATVATRGNGTDAVAPRQLGFSTPNHEKMILRYTNALAAKAKQGNAFRERRVGGQPIVGTSDAYVVAINAGDMPDADIDDGIADIVKAVFGMGRIEYRIPVMGSTGPTTTNWPHRTFVVKESGAEVPTAAFRTDAASGVSAVLFTPRSAWTFEPDAYPYVHIVHNPFARVPLERGAFGFGREWWFDVDGGQLHCKRWQDAHQAS